MKFIVYISLLFILFRQNIFHFLAGMPVTAPVIKDNFHKNFDCKGEFFVSVGMQQVPLEFQAFCSYVYTAESPAKSISYDISNLFGGHH